MHLLPRLDPRCGFAACAINPQLAFATHLFDANLAEVGNSLSQRSNVDPRPPQKS